MHDERLDLAVRCDADPPTHFDVDVRTTTGDRSRYRPLSVPPYLLWRLRDAVTSVLDARGGGPPPTRTP